MREYSSESIIWNIHLGGSFKIWNRYNSKFQKPISNSNFTSDFPLALVCRDNELLDVYHLESHSCLKSLKHESKVLNATLHKGIIGKTILRK